MLHTVFYCKLIDFSDTAETPIKSLFRDELVEVHTGTYYSGASLLNLTLMVTQKFVNKINVSKNRSGFSPCVVD